MVFVLGHYHLPADLLTSVVSDLCDNHFILSITLVCHAMRESVIYVAKSKMSS